MRRKGSAAAPAPHKNLILPQDNFAQRALPSVCRKTRRAS
jgi:hypothetical protein